jgi:type II secretory pathway predicted ATPase ExeA
MDSSGSTVEQDPFCADADGRYIYLNTRQEELLRALISAIAEGRSRLLVTGGEGSGKSAFLRKLAEILYTSCDVALLGHELVFPCEHDTSQEAIEAAVLATANVCESGSEHLQAAVLLLDDADRLDPAVLTSLWHRWPELSAGWSSLSVVMSAMPEQKRLHGPGEHDAMAAEQTFDLPPMALADIEGLIRHRLQIAGLSSSELFTPDALERIAYFSKRVPGRIVQLCQVILAKVGRDSSIPVSGDVVKDAAYELFLPGHLQKLARGLAFQPTSLRALSLPAQQADADASGVKRDDDDGNVDARARYEAVYQDSHRIAMPAPPPGSAAARWPQHPRQHRRLRRGTKLLAVAGAVLLLIVATVMAVGVRQDPQLAGTSFEAAVASFERATEGETEQPTDAAEDSAAGPVALSHGEHGREQDRGQDTPARSASPAASGAEMPTDVAPPRAEDPTPARTAVTDSAETAEPADSVERTDQPAGAMDVAGPEEASPSPIADETLVPVEPRRPPPFVQLNDTAYVQAQLNALGYAAGPVDGILGPRTSAAIQRFQADTGLPIDGRISDTLIASLRRQPIRSNLQNQQRERPRRRIMPAIRGQLDSVRLAQEFREYCRRNQDSWVFDRGTGKFVFCADVPNR